MMSFKDFVHKHNLRNKATSSIKKYEALKNKGLDSKVGIYLRDCIYSTKDGIVNLHPTKRTHWVANTIEIFFDSSGCSPPR